MTIHSKFDTGTAAHGASIHGRTLAWSKMPPLVRFALGWVVLIVLLAIFADLIAPHDYRSMDLRNRLAAPVFMGGSPAHWLGTDELGRDIFSRLLHSIRISLAVAFVASLIATIIGVVIGFLAAYRRGWVEQALLILIDLQASLPFLFLALFFLAIFGNSLLLLIALMSFYGWERTARIARGLALAAQKQTYVDAVRNFGASPWRVYGMHVLPNAASAIVVSMTLSFPEIILLESGLSFLGLGVQPPLTSLGNMVGYGRDYLSSAPWIPLAPSAVIVVTTLAISVVGDWMRDVLDPAAK